MTSALPRYRTRLVHLTAIWAYGVSHPLYTVIDGNPDLLLSRGLTRFDVALFAILLAVVPPAVILAYVWFAGKFSRWVGDTLYLVVLAACLVPLAARALKLLDAGLVLTMAFIVALPITGVIVYARWRAARLFVGYSIVLPIVGLVLFVQGLPALTDEAEAARVRVRAPVPVVFTVFDELPASSLMTRRGAIDSVRYPNFGRLAREGTWYPNATTVHQWTSEAVPAMLTGRVVRAKTLPTVDNLPENLFTLLGEGYSLNVHEAWATRLCPAKYCPRESTTLEDGLGLLVDSVRVLVARTLPRALTGEVIQVNRDIALQDAVATSRAEFDELLVEISRRGAANSLFYGHVLLPHAPWILLPSGLRYDSDGTGGMEMDGSFPPENWDDDQWLVLQGYQRHLLQVGYTDRLLGRLLRGLKRRRLYKRALVVVVADHGTSFRAGEGRRPLTANNLADITNVPMFVKYPGQRHGRVDRRPARTIDLLPTIGDVLGIRLPWQVEGRSLREAVPAGRDVFVDLREGREVHAPLDEMIRDRQSTLEAKTAAFGEGSDSLYRIGTNRWLLGRDVMDGVEESATIQVRIDDDDHELLDVRRTSGFIPARISGRVTIGQVESGAELAVAVNGTVRALTRSFWKDGVQRFRALVPETALREGGNEVDVFLVRGRGEGASLVFLGSNRV